MPRSSRSPFPPTPDSFWGPPPPPPPRRRWWTGRPAVAVGAGFLGLLLGIGVGASDTEDATTALESKVSTLTEQRSQLRGDLAEAKDDMTSMVGADDVQETVDREVAEAVESTSASAQASTKKAVDAAVAKERQRARKLVAKARRDAAAQQPDSEAVADSGGGGGGTDPRFDTCGEANDAGFGPYSSGSDAEYDWYQDRDGDGVVCER